MQCSYLNSHSTYSQQVAVALHPDSMQPNMKKVDQASLKEFKEKLKYLSVYNEDIQQVATKLFEITPSDLELHELVNLVFKCCSRCDISPLLDAILITHPSFTLSPFDQMRRAIVEDTQHLLTNSSLDTMLKETDINVNEARLTACYSEVKDLLALKIDEFLLRKIIYATGCGILYMQEDHRILFCSYSAGGSFFL